MNIDDVNQETQEEQTDANSNEANTSQETNADDSNTEKEELGLDSQKDNTEKEKGGDTKDDRAMTEIALELRREAGRLKRQSDSFQAQQRIERTRIAKQEKEAASKANNEALDAALLEAADLETRLEELTAENDDGSKRSEIVKTRAALTKAKIKANAALAPKPKSADDDGLATPPDPAVAEYEANNKWLTVQTPEGSQVREFARNYFAENGIARPDAASLAGLDRELDARFPDRNKEPKSSKKQGGQTSAGGKNRSGGDTSTDSNPNAKDDISRIAAGMAAGDKKLEAEYLKDLRKNMNNTDI